MTPRIISFGYTRGAPPAADLTIDCRPLPNPHVIPAMRPRSGLDRMVYDWVLDHADTQRLITATLAQVTDTTRTIAVGCSAGRHRSVAVAEALAEALDSTAEHRDLKLKRPAQTTTARGLGHRHQQQRERLLRAHRDGTPCWWCGQPMYRNPDNNFDGAPLEADHSRPRAHHGTTGNHADRLLHRECNRKRGDGTRDHLRPAAPPDTAATVQPATAMPWPT